MPQVIRFDNGQPWATPQVRVPSVLALWLVGLGIDPAFGRPRQSTDNAVVERCHGVLNAWVEPTQCLNLHDLTHHLQAFAELQRTRYPACQGDTRMHAFPLLSSCQRPYHRQHERETWQLQRVLDYVARFSFARKVEKNGRITLMTEEYTLGRAYRYQTVSVRLDPTTRHWVTHDRDGSILRSFAAGQFSYDTIATMRMTFKAFKAKHRVAFHRV
jgi:hypothetical protein